MDASAKQQVIDRIKQASNILVTVSTNPSVDQLSACIGLTLLLNRMDKHATAVFSGKVPSTIEFLQPDKTIETNTDSLRDFIISLDKNKADKLRYKVEDKVVKIFITPYKTSITENDLVYSQGDFNVDVVIALGITDKTHIDTAISTHGRILHDATVISLSAGQTKAQPLGQINWQEPTASSLSEMITSISEAFGAGLIDNQMATAFLTGIVAETSRFSNAKTTPKVMTMSAQLMAAGANQQLIVSKLEPPRPPVPKYVPGQAPVKPKYEGKPEATPQDGSLKVHKNGPNNGEVEIKPDEIHIDSQGNLKTSADVLMQEQMDESQQTMAPPAPSYTPSPAYMTEPKETPIEEKPVEAKLPEQPVPSELSHAFLDPADQSVTGGTQFTANTKPEWEDHDTTPSFDPLSGSMPVETPQFAIPTAAVQPVDAARNAVQNALASSPNPIAPGMPQVLPQAPMQESIMNSEPAPEMSQNDASAAPPPFPPPLSPAQGAVIPDSTASKSSFR